MDRNRSAIIRGIALAAMVLGVSRLAHAAPPATLDDFGDALDVAKVPAAIADLTGDTALMAHVQAMTTSANPASVALARTCATILAKHNVASAAALAATTLPADLQAPLPNDERIRLAALIDHMADLCNQDDDGISQNVPRELMEEIARDCPTPLGRMIAAEYLADQASPPASADAVPDLVPLAIASRALDSAADAIFAMPKGHLELDSLHILKSPEEFFDHYVLIKAKLLPSPTKEGIEGIIDDVSWRVRAAKDADKSADAQMVLDAFAKQLAEIRPEAAQKAAELVEERQLKDTTRLILAAATREDAKTVQPLVDSGAQLTDHLRDQISGTKATQRVWLEYGVMEEPEDPAVPTRVIQLFLGITDDAEKTRAAKMAATFTKVGDKWVLASGLGLVPGK